MWPTEKMKFSPYVIISILLSSFITVLRCEISDQRLCGDSECLEPVSTGRTIIDYPSSDSDILSFKKNVKVLVVSKSAGSRPDLWGVEINGKRGYAPKNFIREEKILKKKLDYLVPTLAKIENVAIDVNSADSENTNESFETPELVLSVENIEKSYLDNSEIKSFNEPFEKQTPGLIPIVKNADKTVEISSESIQTFSQDVQESSKGIIKELNPEPASYEIFGDTVVYYDTNNGGHADKPVTQSNDVEEKISEYDNAVKLMVNSTDFDNVTTSISVSESVETHSNVKADVEDTSKNYESKLDINTRIHEDILSSESLEDKVDKSGSPLKQDNVLDVTSGIIANSKIKANSESQNTIDHSSKQTYDTVQDKLDNNSNNLEHVSLSVETNSTISILDNFNLQQPEVPLINSVNSGIPPYPKILNNNEHESGTSVKQEVISHEHNKVNNYLLINHETLNDDLKPKEKGILEQVKSSNKIVKRDTLAQSSLNEIFNTNTGIPSKITNDNVADKPFPDAFEISVNNKYIEQYASQTQLPRNNLEISAINENPVIHEEETLLNSIISENYELSAPKEILANEASLKKPTMPENPDILNTNALNEPEEGITISSTENYKEVHESEILKKNTDENPATNKNFINNPTFNELNTDVVKKSLEKSYLNSLLQDDNNIKASSSIDQVDMSSKNEIRLDPAKGNIEEVIYKEASRTTENLDEMSNNETDFISWLHGLIFGSSSNKSADPENDLIEQNLDELDNRHDGLLSRVANDAEVCKDPKSNCYKPGEFTEHSEMLSEDLSGINSVVYDIAVNSRMTYVYLIITAITILIFTLGYYYIETWRQDGGLIRKVNTLEQALMVSSKECELLKENLDATQLKLTSIKEGAFGSNEEVISLKEDKEKLEIIIKEKEKQILELQKEVEAATETGLELNKMLHDMMLTAQKGDTIAESMEQAQLQLNEQKETINAMTNMLSTRSKENSALQIKQKEFETKIETMKKLLNEESHYNKSLQDERKKIEEQVQSLNTQLLNIKDHNSYEMQQVHSVLLETKKNLYAKTNQVQLLEECIRTLKSGDSVDIRDLANIAELQSELQRVTHELNILSESNAKETEITKKLEGDISRLEDEIARLQLQNHKAEKDKTEAQTRLEVLSGYFKEKESQLQKELGIQEALWQQKQGEATSTVERLHTMQDEIQSLKSQNQSLRLEIEQEAAAHRNQVTTLESRVHEAWLSSRQAERKLEESRQEASTLRRKLTSLVEQENIQKRGSSPLEVQLAAASPIHMNSAASPMLPPPPLPFLPPPFLPPPLSGHSSAPPPPPHFLPPFMGDMRPPPLGRLPSPPRHRRGHYSPSMASERYSPESRAYSPESRAYSPDSRAYSPDYRRPISPYDTETDLSPPVSPYRNGGKYNPYHSNRRDENKRLSKGANSAESTETLNRNGRNHTAKAV